MPGNWNKNIVVGVILGIVIIAASFIAVKGTMPKKDVSTYTAILKCDACGDVFGKKLSVAERFPVKCPACGKQTAYHAGKCLTCGEIFAMKPQEPEEGKEKPPWYIEQPRCPKCGSTKMDSVKELPQPESKK